MRSLKDLHDLAPADHFLSLSLTLLDPCLTFTTFQMCLLCFCLKGFALAVPLSPKPNLCFIQISAQILTPWTNPTLTPCPKQHFCCSLSHYTVLCFFHCHLSQLDLPYFMVVFQNYFSLSVLLTLMSGLCEQWWLCSLLCLRA